MNTTFWIGKFTRWLQSRNRNKPVGISTLSRTLYPILPDYQGIVELEEGLRMQLDTTIPPERGIFFAGDRHRVITTIMRQYVKSGAYCMDIGANIGYYTLKLAQLVGSAGHVVAFEPNPTLVKRIQENIFLNNFNHIEVINKAINDTSHTSTFYIAANSELSSLEYRSDAVQELVVDATTIDAYMQTSGLHQLDFIKIDIEGFDCHALLGGRQTIRKFRPYIVLEYHYGSKTAIADEAFGMLKDFGYTIEGVILKNGQRSAFDWRKPQTTNHINVFCMPNKIL